MKEMASRVFGVKGMASLTSKACMASLTSKAWRLCCFASRALGQSSPVSLSLSFPVSLSHSSPVSLSQSSPVSVLLVSSVC